NSQAVAAIDDLDGERLVQLPQVNVSDGEAESLEQLGHRKHGADPHLVRLAPGNGKSTKDDFGFHAKRLGPVALHHEHSASAVGKLRRVSGRYRALSAVRIEVRLERGQ